MGCYLACTVTRILQAEAIHSLWLRPHLHDFYLIYSAEQDNN